MRIAANLNVLDETEFIEICIRHLRAIGVDLIVVTDLGSIDGTADRLEEFAKDPDICLIRIRRYEDLWDYPARMYARTISEFAVDRVLFLDADEFWVPRGGNIKATADLAQAGALSVRRLNVPLVEGRSVLPADLSPAGYHDLYVVASPVENAVDKLQKDTDLAWIMTKVQPKMIVNPRVVERLEMGDHGILKRAGTNPTIVKPDDLIIAHFPFTTYDRFSKKMANIEKWLTTFGHLLTEIQVWHWKRWVQLAKQGNAEQEFRRQVLTQHEFDEAVSKGVIQSVQTIFGAADSAGLDVSGQRP